MSSFINQHKFLRDEVATIILTDKSCIEYVETIVSIILNIPREHLKLELLYPLVYSNSQKLKKAITDAVFDSDKYIINIEVNSTKTDACLVKNNRYIYHLLLNQIPKAVFDKLDKQVIQINLNAFDFFNHGDFIYESLIMNKKYHEVRRDDTIIFDINLDQLTKIPYNKIKEMDEYTSLEKLLYFFVCEDANLKSKLYTSDMMKKVMDKSEKLTNEFLDGLYYDYDEFKKAELYQAGMNDGINDNIKNIAKTMLNKKYPLKDISEITGLKIEDIKKLTKE